ncbi:MULTISPECIES: Ger(x)C family spore germination protein [unclassified Paenibacillus]|uniref:Ger(x)C family spore germination protein n=1 Tax=unclassified Paenibacillus TaxID=185978 RepID=UPI0036315A9F
MKGTGIRSMLLLVIGAASCLLSGCWDRMEVNDMAIILAAGIDQGAHNEVELSLQVFIPASGNSSVMTQDSRKSSGRGEQTLVSVAKGTSLADAVSHLQERLSRRLFWGHNKIFVFGKQRAEAGVKDDLDFLLRYVEMRERADMYVSEGKAIDVMRVIPELERSSMEALRELSKTEVSTEVDLRDVIEQIVETPGQTFYVPYVLSGSAMSHENFVRNTAAPYFKGLAIFKEGKMVGNVDNNLTRGVLWLTNKIKKTTITVVPASVPGNVSISLSRNESRLQPHINANGKWGLTISIQCEGDVLQNTSSLDLMKPDQMHLIEEKASELIRSRVMGALEKIKKGMGADVFGIGEAFHRKYPRQWNKEKMKWRESFSEIDIELTIYVHILRPGIMSKNIPSLNQKER